MARHDESSLPSQSWPSNTCAEYRASHSRRRPKLSQSLTSRHSDPHVRGKEHWMRPCVFGNASSACVLLYPWSASTRIPGRTHIYANKAGARYRCKRYLRGPSPYPSFFEQDPSEVAPTVACICTKIWHAAVEARIGKRSKAPHIRLHRQTAFDTCTSFCPPL